MYPESVHARKSGSSRETQWGRWGISVMIGLTRQELSYCGGDGYRVRILSLLCLIWSTQEMGLQCQGDRSVKPLHNECGGSTPACEGRGHGGLCICLASFLPADIVPELGGLSVFSTLFRKKKKNLRVPKQRRSNSHVCSHEALLPSNIPVLPPPPLLEGGLKMSMIEEEREEKRYIHTEQKQSDESTLRRPC
ncbi:unnamed protein product [Discosporangium mesarthrocarpum]